MAKHYNRAHLARLVKLPAFRDIRELLASRGIASTQLVGMTHGGTKFAFLVTFDARGCSKPHGPCTSCRSMKRKDSFASNPIGAWVSIRSAIGRLDHRACFSTNPLQTALSRHRAGPQTP